MFVDAAIGSDLAAAATRSLEAEDSGFDAVWSSESGHDPFLPLVIAAEQTERICLGTAIAVAFGRTPMVLAHSAWDIQMYSGGRFFLGLGSQVKPHIEKRYSMPWSSPAARMREYIAALHAIWDSWQNGTRLDFRGDYYTHTLMTPFFDPGPCPHGPPKVFLAAVGEMMTTVAGEMADGLLAHSFSTERYLREVTIPALEAGLAASGRTRADVQVSCPVFVVTGGTAEQLALAEAATRRRIAFYGSTRDYRPVLEIHGWGDLQPALNGLARQGEWDAMSSLVGDEVLDAFAVRGSPAEVAATLRARYGGVADRVSFNIPYPADDAPQRILAALQDTPRSAG
jgi:probable F420-dependent oxidoreductase